MSRSYLRLTRSYDLGSSPPVWRSSGGGGGIARHIPPLLSARRRGKIDARNFVSIFSTILEGRENRGAARCRTRAKVRELRGSYERHPAGSPSAGTGASSRPPVSWAAFKALSCPPSAHMEKKIAALTASSALSGDRSTSGRRGRVARLHDRLQTSARGVLLPLFGLSASLASPPCGEWLSFYQQPWLVSSSGGKNVAQRFQTSATKSGRR